jgi:S-methylmethionine-dependent homocysteine/selenocysteine methylase
MAVRLYYISNEIQWISFHSKLYTVQRGEPAKVTAKIRQDCKKFEKMTCNCIRLEVMKATKCSFWHDSFRKTVVQTSGKPENYTHRIG